MDEAKLKRILREEQIPPVDINAKKAAINLAVAEFKGQSTKKAEKISNPSQGFSMFTRLIGKSKTTDRRDKMERTYNKKLVFGGMATAMAVVLIAGVSYTQLQDFSKQFSANKVIETVSGTSGELAPVTPPAAQPRADEKQTLANASTMPERTALSQAPSGQPAAIQENRQRLEKVKKDLAPQAPIAMKESYEADALSGAAAGIGADMSVMSRMMIAPVTDMPPPAGYHDVGRDKFEDFQINPLKLAAEEPVSTFSVDVDTASYSFVRRQLNQGVLPQKDAVRAEEMINYFDYDYQIPAAKEEPFKANVVITPSPWAEGKQLMQIGIKGYDIPKTEAPHSNLVFLLDVSGSMNEPDKLPLLKNSMKMLLDSLRPDDTVAIAVYAGAAGTVLEPTKVSEKAKISTAIDNLQPGGGTAGAAGINLAYQLAEQNFNKEGVNRVILATDGDFNVGITSPEELKDFVERKRETGIFLSVLGFGQGNYNDAMMQTLAQNGNGVAAYIDSLNEARKVLVEEASSTLFPIAKDVKIQVEFNPKTVAEYRLIGYETRALNREDFNNDKIDAGDIGAGHAVTAIYEITPAGSAQPAVDPLRYADGNEPAKTETHKADVDFKNELAFVKIRYKLPDGDTSKLITTPVTSANDLSVRILKSGDDLTATALREARWAGAVAGFAQILQGGQYTGAFSYDDVINLAEEGKGPDKFGYRAEFINLVRLAKSASTMQPQ